MALGTTNGTTEAGKASSGWSSFFGNVASGFGEGLQKIGSEILPNWAKRQVTEAKEEPIKQPTFDQQVAPARVETGAVQSPVAKIIRPMQETLFTVGGVKVTPLYIAFGFGALLIGAVVWKAVT